ncbi:MAG: DUF1294 domain-containing protein [Bacilli bacterium]|nr:DUF1294 domain-containing protein [Bacilli bacterium]
MIYYLIVLNIITFFLYMIDKYLAIKRKRRISEYHLLTLSILGGAFFALISMYLFHHKTRKRKFLLINLVFSLIWIFIVINYNLI